MLNDETTLSFRKALLWNFIGSSLYELVKVFHNFYLLGNMTSYSYGQVGFIFSSIYLAVRIADLGNAYSTVPFLHDLQRSQAICKNILIKFFLLPQLPIIILGAIFLCWRINPEEIKGIFIACIFILETYRLFLRYLLHAQFKNSNVVIVELSSFILFLSCIWMPYWFFGLLSLKTILLAHFVDSLVATANLSWLSIKRYKELPAKVDNEISPPLKSLIYGKIFTYLNRLSREITSSNVLTPLYATLFGFEKVSIFYFLGITTTAYQMIIKNTITYSGNALLAQLKNAPNKIKNHAFHLITEKLLLMLIPPLFVIMMLYKEITHFLDKSIVLMLIGFLILMGLDLIMYIYEQYYLVQDSAKTFFSLKMTESLVCLAIFYIGPKWSIVQAFSSFIAIKLLITFITMIHSYTVWNLKLKWHKIIVFTTIITALSLFLKLFISTKVVAIP